MSYLKAAGSGWVVVHRWGSVVSDVGRWAIMFLIPRQGGWLVVVVVVGGMVSCVLGG